MARPQPLLYFFLFPRRRIIFFLWITLFGMACNKSINQSSYKANITITNLIQGGDPVNIYYNSVLLNTLGLIQYDSTSAYFPVISGIRNFRVSTASTPPPSINYLNGNVGLEAGVDYSIFLYDSLSNNLAQALILQNNLTPLPDTISAFRFVNLFPSSIDSSYYILTNLTDTFRFGYIPFIGPEAQPNNLSGFNIQILNGAYSFGIMTDSVTIISGIMTDSVTIRPIDSLYFAGGKLYTLYAWGTPNGMGGDSMKLSLLQQN